MQSLLAGGRKVRYGRIIMGSLREKNFWNPIGFTLMELVFVMIIIAIVSGIAFPTFQKFSVEGKLKAAAREITGDFGIAKALASAESRDYEIVFNQGNNTYSLRPSGGTILQTKSPASMATDIQINSADFSGGNTVAFTTRGTCTDGTVELINGQGSKAIIKTNITGRTYVRYEFK